LHVEEIMASRMSKRVPFLIWRMVCTSLSLKILEVFQMVSGKAEVFKW
jgi:hypothetical protein